MFGYACELVRMSVFRVYVYVLLLCVCILLSLALCMCTHSSEDHQHARSYCGLLCVYFACYAVMHVCQCNARPTARNCNFLSLSTRMRELWQFLHVCMHICSRAMAVHTTQDRTAVCATRLQPATQYACTCLSVSFNSITVTTTRIIHIYLALRLKVQIRSSFHVCSWPKQVCGGEIGSRLWMFSCTYTTQTYIHRYIHTDSQTHRHTHTQTDTRRHTYHTV